MATVELVDRVYVSGDGLYVEVVRFDDGKVVTTRRDRVETQLVEPGGLVRQTTVAEFVGALTVTLLALRSEL